MGVSEKQTKRLVQTRSAMLLLIEAGFFILISLPDIGFCWAVLFENQSKLKEAATTGYLEFLIISRIVFSMSNSIFYVIIGTCRKGSHN